MQHFKNKIWLIFLSFTEKVYFALDWAECNRFVQHVFPSAPWTVTRWRCDWRCPRCWTRTPSNSPSPEPLKHELGYSLTQNQHTWTLVPAIVLVSKILPNEPTDVGAAQVTSAVTRDCQKSHMPGGTGAWRHLSSPPIVTCFTLSPGLSGCVGSGLVWLGFYGTREKRRWPCGLSDERVEPSNEYSEFYKTTRTWTVLD